MDEAEKGTLGLAIIEQSVYRSASRLLSGLQDEFVGDAADAGLSKGAAVVLFYEMKRRVLEKLLAQCI